MGEKTAFDENLSYEELESRADKLVNEIIYSKDPMRNTAWLLFKAVQLLASHHAITERAEHEVEYHK